MNKKGIAEPIVDIFAFFAVILLFVVFGAIFSFMTQHHAFEIGENKEEVDSGVELLQILRTPVEVNGYETDYAAYIALAFHDEEMQNKLKDDLQGLLSNYVEKTNVSAARISILDSEKGIRGGQLEIAKGKIHSAEGGLVNVPDSQKHTSHVTIPSYRNRTIKVVLELKNE